ncbi:MAG TPA: zinc finger domain-containing protein, partial [Geminicoccaceae bacterium]|nr:zinc finger domain-containing protein [Geminicoccaceae bacterium]
AEWRDPELGERWERVRRVRRVITGALELERKEKRIGASLQAAPTVYLGEAERAAVEGLDLAELAITSGIELTSGAAPEGAFALEDVPGVAVVPGLAEGEKCARCWQVLPEVAASPEHLCRRCTAAVAALDAR